MPHHSTLRCRIFGHKWRTFDADWCGKDYQMCERLGLFPLQICGAVRSIDTPGAKQ
jgi:hypothetical protein